MSMTIVASTDAVTIGDAATWVGSLGTILGLGVALALLVQGSRDRRMAQARLVSVELGHMHVEHRAGTKFKVERGTRRQLYPHAELFTSLSPDANDEYTFERDAFGIDWSLTNNSPEELGVTVVDLVDLDGDSVYVLDKAARVRSGPDQGHSMYYLPGVIPIVPVRIRVRFTDAAGRAWVRVGGSRVRRLSRRSARALVAHDPSSGVWMQTDEETSALRIYTDPEDWAAARAAGAAQ